MTRDDFRAPIEQRYWEDYAPGSVHEYGSISVDAAEIIAFGQRFDPQVFHTDPEGAKKTIYGGLIASGWHTSSLMMRLYSDHYLSSASSLGSPGVDEMRWVKPVRPGDTLSIRVSILSSQRSRSKPDRGLVRSFIEVLNQNQEVVMTMKALNLFLCRERPA